MRCQFGGETEGQMLPRTTIAGRHAADRQRARERAPLPDPKLAALEALAALLRKRPMRVFCDFHAAGGALPTIAAKVRLEYFFVDYVFIDAAVNDLGWRRNLTTSSRHTEKYDMRVLDHAASGARLLLIITLPHGEIEHVEAA
jgi:hypothetical protein